jgi:hypothetical protein
MLVACRPADLSALILNYVVTVARAIRADAILKPSRLRSSSVRMGMASAVCAPRQQRPDADRFGQIRKRVDVGPKTDKIT